MRRVVIVQARTGSTRLPGKVLMPLAGRSALGEVLRRCAAIPDIDLVCCATTTLPADDAVAEEAARWGAAVVRGSVEDVLDRYLAAAVATNADVAARVTSDCPLIDPELCARVMAPVADGTADYACDNDPPTWPHGLDCEAFTRDALSEAHRMASAPGDREHVTPWLRRAADKRRVNVPAGHDRDRHRRWTLDYPEDHAFLAAVFACLPPPPAIPTTAEVLALLDARPELEALNAMRRQR